jgi:hypothetical protein
MAAEGMRKITLELPTDLLERAQRAVYWRGPQHGYAVRPA